MSDAQRLYVCLYIYVCVCEKQNASSLDLSSSEQTAVLLGAARLECWKIPECRITGELKEIVYATILPHSVISP